MSAVRSPSLAIGNPSAWARSASTLAGGHTMVCRYPRARRPRASVSSDSCPPRQASSVSTWMMERGRRKINVAVSAAWPAPSPGCNKICLMIRLKWLVICALLCAANAYSESKWIRMQSPNFVAYSSAGERDTRDTLRYFERVRDFFLQVNQRELPKPVPVYVVVFGSEKEYAPYRFNEFATAYYFGGADRDYIVMGRTGRTGGADRRARIRSPGRPPRRPQVSALAQRRHRRALLHHANAGRQGAGGRSDSRPATGFIAGKMGAAFRDPRPRVRIRLITTKRTKRAVYTTRDGRWCTCCSSRPSMCRSIPNF